jgi:hypothetical protein
MLLEVTTISLAGGAHQSSEWGEFTWAPIILVAGLLMDRGVTTTSVHYEERISPFGSKMLGTVLPPTRTRVRLVIEHDEGNATFLWRHLPIKDFSEVFLCLCHAAWVRHFLSLLSEDLRPMSHRRGIWLIPTSLCSTKKSHH